MRDDHYFTSYVTGQDYWGPVSRKTVITDSRRDDSKKTIPGPNGVYFRPTSYRAFFFRYTPLPGSGIANGPLGPRPYSFSGLATSEPFPWVTRYGGVTADSFNSPAISAACANRAASLIQQQVRNQEYDFGQTLGELPETLRFIATALEDMIRGYRALRQGNFGKMIRYLPVKPRRAVKSASQAYVAYQYGIKPLISDVQAAAKGVETLIANAYGRAYVNVKDTEYGPPEVYRIANSDGYVKGEFIRGRKIELFFRIANPELYALDRYGLLNPYALAWELLPLSFVLDWFVHVGSFLQAFTTPLAIAFDSGYQTDYLSNIYECRWIGDAVAYRGLWPGMQIRHRSMRRTLLVSFPIPLPYLDLGLNWSQLVSLAALVGIRF